MENQPRIDEMLTEVNIKIGELEIELGVTGRDLVNTFDSAEKALDEVPSKYGCVLEFCIERSYL